MAGRAAARAVALPAESGLVPLAAGADLADAYAIALPAHAPAEPEALARCIFGSLGGRVHALLRLRDGIMAPFGVKTTRRLGRDLTLAGRSHVGFFRVQWRRPTEIALGEDDRHLDFRTSILVRDAWPDAGTEPGQGAGREVVAITVVHCHTFLGRAYLAAIAPFHRAIVRSSLDRAARAGWRPPAPGPDDPGSGRP